MEITGKKISELEERTELGGGEYIPFADSGSNGKIKVDTIKQYLKPITFLTDATNIPSEIIPALSISYLNTGSITSDQFISLKKLLNDNNNQLGYIVSSCNIIDNNPVYGIIFVFLYYHSDSDTIHFTSSDFKQSKYRQFSNTGEMTAIANDYNEITADDFNQVNIKVSKGDNYLDYILLPLTSDGGKDTEFLNQLGGITDIQPIYNTLNNILERLAILESYHDGGAID